MPRLAKRADCSAESTRTSFYADFGIVVRHEDRPVGYERNDDYFEWRRVNELTQENTVDELQAHASELTDRVTEYRDDYGVDSPTEVDVLDLMRNGLTRCRRNSVIGPPSPRSVASTNVPRKSRRLDDLVAQLR
ncbi:DUF7342 family protein [Natronococcus occultus]